MLLAPRSGPTVAGAETGSVSSERLDRDAAVVERERLRPKDLRVDLE
jgi:hypothetical protein